MGRFNAAFLEKNKANQNKGQSPVNNSSPEMDVDRFASAVSNTDVPINETKPEQEVPTINVSKPNEYDTKQYEEIEAPHPTQSSKVFRKININEIDFAKDNPFRKNDKTEYGQEELEELANNIAVFGLLHPLLVNHINGRYVLISGERRLKAVKKLGWNQVDCIVTEVSDAVFEKGMLHSANTEVRRTIKPFEMFGYIYELLNIYKSLSDNNQSNDLIKDKYQYVANSLSISKRQLFKYTNIMKNLDILTSDEKEQLENGDLSINKAYEIIRSRNNGTESSADANEEEEISSPEQNSDNTNIDDDSDISADYSEKNTGDIESSDFAEESEPVNDSSADSSISENDESNTNEESKDNFAEKEASSSTEDNPVLNDINNKFIKTLFNPFNKEDIQLYNAISLITNRNIFGVPCCIGDKAYMVFPSKIVSDYPEEEAGKKVIDITIRCYEVKKDTLRKRGE